MSFNPVSQGSLRAALAFKRMFSNQQLQETVQALLKAASNNPDFKMNKESLAVTCELLTAFTTEVVMRSTQQALQRRSSMAHASELDGGDTKLDVNCLERVLPQLLLDFN